MQVNDHSRKVLADIAALRQRSSPEDAEIIAAMVGLWERDTAALLGLASALERTRHSVSVLEASNRHIHAENERLRERLSDSEALNNRNGHATLALVREIHTALGQALDGKISSLEDYYG